MKKTTLFILLATLIVVLAIVGGSQVKAIDAKKGELVATPTAATQVYKVDDMKGGIVCYILIAKDQGNSMSCIRYRQ